jgi:type I restriction-modification system DNA methylase subunit
MTKEIAYIKIEELVTRFTDQIASYKKSDYNETQTRRDFIDPFFKALGWDVDNENGNAEAYREVIHEDRVKVGKATKAPDYSFRLSGGKRLFFVEAKKPSVFIKDEILPAYQVRRYGWSAKLAISIITDFEEFAIYDCSKKPLPTDKAAVARIKYLNYKDYLTEFDFIWDTFSKEKVLKGSFDKFIQGTANKKGTSTVDKAFLETLDNCRTILAESIAKLNPALDEDEINFAVQQTIDRIIFLRIAEDRSIEPYGKLQESLKFGNYYTNLFGIFKIADDKYNSGLFNFKKDTISQNLQIDNKVLKTIINQFYYPECPYEFSVLSVEILGSAYEQFLGKTITINKNHKAVIELKPEVRKAGGVYYTPQYIVDYIVENTLGKLTQNKTPKQVAELKIVDPACGSGSFLIGAYQHLLNWHSTYYQQNETQAKKDKAFTPTGSLSTSIKKQILLNNIYGVDIDVNAVEVTKLSLLLKCMEGETQASIATQASLFNERVLPTLDDNIKSGNSLIDLDYYDNQLDFGEEKKIKPFNWQKAFNNVFKLGGFDVAIGNPPYVTIGGKEDTLFDKSEIIYLLNKYISNQYKPNLYAFFYERGLSLLKENGLVSYIVPRTIIDNIYYKSLRELIVENHTIETIVKLNYEVFEDATTGGTSICIFKKNNKNKKNNVNTKDVKNIQEFSSEDYLQIPQTEILIGDNKSFSFSSKSEISIINKLDNSKRISIFCSVNNGVNTGNCAEILLSTKKETVNHRKILEGKNINRYTTNWKGLWVNYDPTIRNRINISDLKTKQNKIDFALRDENIFNSAKIIVRQTGDKIIANIDFDKYVTRHSTHCLVNDFEKIDMLFLLGVLNSKATNFYYNFLIPEKGKAFAEVKGVNIKQLPVPIINKSNEHSYDQIIKFVNQLLQLNKDLQATTLETKKEQIKNKIDYSEDKINELVYQLYNLTEEEIEIVAGN